MSRRPRRNHSPAFKATVALDAIRGEKTLAELAKRHVGAFIAFYNTRRPHSSLGKKTPDAFYVASLPAIQRAA